MINELIKLMEDISMKEIPENENPKKVTNIVERILNFNEPKKGKRHLSDLSTCLKILTSEQMFWRLAIALAQSKAGSTSENLLNKFRQIIYSGYWAK